MSAVLALQAARRLGAILTVQGNELMVSQAKRLPPDLLADLHKHRDDLVELLTLAAPLAPSRPHPAADDHLMASTESRPVLHPRLEPRAVRSRRWWAEYTAYLQSADWRAKRELALQRDTHGCQARLAVCISRATQVHHLSYEHWQDAPLWELASVCEPCHQALTAQDRARRGRGSAP